MAFNRRYQKFQQQRPQIPKYERNFFIKADVLFVIDEAGEQLGEMKKEEAIKMAQERGLDLVEVSPNAKPPVAKIIDWSKFKYEQEKKKKESKGKKVEMKEMWFQAFIGDGDLGHKLKKVHEFLDKKHQVKLTIRHARGKRYDRDIMTDLMKKIITMLGEKIKFEGNAKFEGRNYVIIVSPNK